MGGKTTKSSTQTVDSSNMSSTPNVPDWLKTPYQAQAGQVAGLVGQNPSQYAPTTGAVNSKAFDAASGLTGTNPLYTDAATRADSLNLTPPQVQAQSLLTGLDQYYTPFKDQVMNPVLNDLDVSAGQTRAAQAAKEAATGSFRGSRAGIAEGQTEGDLARARAATTGGLLNDMYGQAVAASNQDAARRQDASTANASNTIAANSQRLQRQGLLSSIAQNENADARANVGTQLAAGAQQQTVQDAIKQYPLQYQAQIEGLLAGLNPDLFTGKTVNSSGTSNTNSKTTQSGSVMDTIGKVAQVAALFI